jgi:hypothetical protein
MFHLQRSCDAFFPEVIMTPEQEAKLHLAREDCRNRGILESVGYAMIGILISAVCLLFAMCAAPIPPVEAQGMYGMCGIKPIALPIICPAPQQSTWLCICDSTNYCSWVRVCQ